MNKLTTKNGRVLHLTRDFDTYKRMKDQGYDVHIVSRQMLERQYPYTCRMTIKDNDLGMTTATPTFNSIEDEILFWEKAQQNGKIIGIYEN